MGGVKLKNRFYLIVGAIILFSIIGIVALVSSGNKSASKPSATSVPTAAPLSFTVSADIGIDTIEVTNLNTGATIILTTTDLPATYTFTRSDTLTFNVTAKSGYVFNAWVFGDMTFQSDNPYTIKATSTFTMEAKFLTETS
jgi:hypothetical protein